MSVSAVGIPAPKQMCYVRNAEDKVIVGQASNYAEFQTLVSSLTNEKLHFQVDNDWFIATDDYDSVKFVCTFNDFAEVDPTETKSSHFDVFDLNGNLVGLCDDVDGFRSCVCAVSSLKDLCICHNTENTAFCAKDACNRILYYSKPSAH